MEYNFSQKRGKPVLVLPTRHTSKNVHIYPFISLTKYTFVCSQSMYPENQTSITVGSCCKLELVRVENVSVLPYSCSHDVR